METNSKVRFYRKKFTYISHFEQFFFMITQFFIENKKKELNYLTNLFFSILDFSKLIFEI